MEKMYLNALKELEYMVQNDFKNIKNIDFVKLKKLIDICIEGQNKGIKELQPLKNL